MGNLWNFRRVLLYSLSGVFGLDYLYAFDTGRSLVLIWSAIQLKSQVLDIYRDKKIYLPFLAYAILGIFSVQYFFYLCVEYSNATTATILQFISPVFILFTIAWFIKNERQKALFSMFWLPCWVFA